MDKNKISEESLALLHEQLPPLSFDPATDIASSQLPVARDYLSYYHLHPEDFEPELDHFLGMNRVQLSDGEVFNVACHYWLKPSAKGTAFVVHGYFDHVGLYGHLIRELLTLGFNVVAFDLPGHGISDGERATVASFNHYVEVFDAICVSAKQNLPSPWHAIGQSTGGAIVLKHLLEEEQDQLGLSDNKTYTFDRITLLAPLIYPRFWRVNRLVYFFTRPFLKRINRVFAPNSGDEDFFVFLKTADPLQARHLSLEWIGAMKFWIKEFSKLPKSDFPVVIVQGERDATVDWKTNLKLLNEKFVNARVHIFPKAQHHLVNETEILRKEIFSLLDGALDKF